MWMIVKVGLNIIPFIISTVVNLRNKAKSLSHLIWHRVGVAATHNNNNNSPYSSAIWWLLILLPLLLTLVEKYYKMEMWKTEYLMEVKWQRLYWKVVLLHVDSLQRYFYSSSKVLLFYRFLIVKIPVKDHSFTMSPIILKYLSTELSFILLVAL